MRAVCQRVSRARVTVAGETVGEIGQGLLVLLGVARGDTEEVARRMAEKIARLRIFEDDDGRFARSVLDVGGAALVVSQSRWWRTRPRAIVRASPRQRRRIRRSLSTLRRARRSTRRACPSSEGCSALA